MRRAACLSVVLMVAAGARGAVKASAGEAGVRDWRMRDASVVEGRGEAVSQVGFGVEGWYRAVVPGTALTTLVKAGVYPEPMYGENNRAIPESLARTAWWYRAVVRVPVGYAGRKVWLNFDGVNYAAEVWVNGTRVGEMRGAFARGRFEVSKVVKPGGVAVVGVLVKPEPHPGVPHEHTLAAGMGLNGGVTAADGPTFLSTIGWDWLPAIRDRDTGIWRKVFLSATGDVRVEEPLVTSKLPLPRTDEADLAVSAVVENVSEKAVSGVLRGAIGAVRFSRAVTVGAGEKVVVKFGVGDTPGLRLEKPRLWWPNGVGPEDSVEGGRGELAGLLSRSCPKCGGMKWAPGYGVPGVSGGVKPAEMYSLRLEFVEGGRVSDGVEVPFGVREIRYSVPGSENLTLSVNGVKVFVRGGDWGLDDAMKRIPRARLEAQIRMHALARLNMIRNWVGQSTSEDFYELCDKYGILLWDEFFQPNPSDGPNPEDVATYMANAREKIVRFRNHPSIAVWCGRNEGAPPREINDALQKLMDELEPVRRYQPSSTDGAGVRSGGPYRWRAPAEFYKWSKGEVFKTEMGSVSIPTLESVRGMMPAKDWETVNDDWAEHDFARGASGSDTYRAVMGARYGAVGDLADFVRKGQMMNYEAYRAMFEGRQARMFAPSVLPNGSAALTSTGVITWMSHPAQPSFVWQLYHYDLEPNASLFAVRSAGERVHAQLNEASGEIEVVNNLPGAFAGTLVYSSFAADGLKMFEKELRVGAAGSSVARLGEFDNGVVLGPVHFVELELRDAKGVEVSRNVYWRGTAAKPDDLTGLAVLPFVTLKASVSRTDFAGKTRLVVTLRNPTEHVALMAHLQMRRASGERVLPVFAGENYVSLMPGEERRVEMEAGLVVGEVLVVVDGWNVGMETARAVGVEVRAASR